MEKQEIKEIRKVNTGEIEISFDTIKEDFNGKKRYYFDTLLIPANRFKDLIKVIEGGK